LSGQLNKEALIKHLVSLPEETEWLEFKENFYDPDKIGKYISALSNGALLKDERFAYLVFGVRNSDHLIVGTSVRLNSQRKGAEPLESWLARKLDPSVFLEFLHVTIDGKEIDFIKITPAYYRPLKFAGKAFIRIGETTKPLDDFPEIERTLWSITARYSFETNISKSHLSEEDVFDLFDVAKILKALDAERSNRKANLEKLVSEGLLFSNYEGTFDATNLLALLAANDLREFPKLETKSVRLIVYSGKSNSVAKLDITGKYGYCLRFEDMLDHIMSFVDGAEQITDDNTKRVYVHSIPKVSVREILANALIHQDFTNVRGPVVEVFSDRLKVTNPGSPLVEVDRLIDTPSKTRNEKLASAMRVAGYCEKRGSGIDRALSEVERLGLPAPLFQKVSDSTVVTLFGPRPFKEMSKEDRILACYQHACLQFERNSHLTNGSLRERFKLPRKQYPQVSIVISDAKASGRIKPLDENQGNKFAKYIPYWA